MAAPPRSALARLAAAACALAATACHPRVAGTLPSGDPAALLAEVVRAQEAVQRVQGEARLKLRSPQGSGTVRQFIAAERPDRLHLETLDFFGNVMAVLVAADGRFSLYDGQQKVLYRGPATPANLARLVPIPLPAGDLVTILCGSAPLRGAPEAAEREGDGLALRLVDGDAITRARIGQQAIVEQAERKVAGGAGTGSWTMSFALHRAYGEAYLPGRTTLQSPPAHLDLELDWTEVQVNGDPAPALFRLDPPRGARIVEVGESDPIPDTLFQPPPPPTPRPGS